MFSLIFLRGQGWQFEVILQSIVEFGEEPVAMSHANISVADGDTAGVAPILRRHGLIAESAEPRFSALTGGVASDIWLVTSGDQTFVVKRALAKLRVHADWRAPLARNAAEVAWLRTAARIVPHAAPRILGHDAGGALFVMEYLSPADHPLWKSQLAAGKADPSFAAKVGASIAQIHAATAGDSAIAREFANDSTFHAIRLEPYLEYTAARHPDLRERLYALSRLTLETKHALVHGDLSPKNILNGPHGPVFLDAECAWYGDPAFDLAFCLNHMLLKVLWVLPARAGFLACFDSLSDAYFAGVGWEQKEDLERRAAELLPALLLARIDGKSPVEYISGDRPRALAREFARSLIATPPRSLAEIREGWNAQTKFLH
jgi:aminoglycoside phosphotransferase (APT) family kinase protein